MKSNHDRRDRRVLGKLSADTKGPPGVVMEGTGLWNGHNSLTD